MSKSPEDAAAERKKLGPGFFLGTGVVYMAVGVFVYCYSAASEVPEIGALSSESGEVQWAEEIRSGFRAGSQFPRFKLRGSDKVFQYSHKAEQSEFVLRILGSTTGELVEVLYDKNDPHRPLFSRVEIFTVYSISVDGKTLRSYEDVVSAWSDDNTFGRYFGAFLVLVGLGLTAAGLKMYRSRAQATTD